MTLPLEESLIVECYRQYAHDRSLKEKANDTGQVDWPRLLEVAKQTKTFPLLFDSLQCVIPAAVRSQWHTEAALRSARATSKVQAVLKVRDCAEKIGVSPTFVKGVGLGVMLYNGVQHAPYGDVDVVVNSDYELTRLDDCLLTDGFYHTHSLIHAKMLGDERRVTEFPFRGKWYPDGPQLMMPSSTGYVSVELKTHHSSIATEDMWIFGSARERIHVQRVPIWTYDKNGTWALLIVRAFRLSDGMLSVAEGLTPMRSYLDLRVAAERWKDEIDPTHLYSVVQRAGYVERCSRVLQNLHELFNDTITHTLVEDWKRSIACRHPVRSRSFFLYPTIDWGERFIARLLDPLLTRHDLRRAALKNAFSRSNPEYDRRYQLIEDSSLIPPIDRFLVYNCGGESVRYCFMDSGPTLSIWMSATGDAWEYYGERIIQFRFLCLFCTEEMLLDVPMRICVVKGSVAIERRHARDATPRAGERDIRHGSTWKKEGGHELLARLDVPKDWLESCYDAGAPYNMLAYSVSIWSRWSGTLFGPCDTRIRAWPQLIEYSPKERKHTDGGSAARDLRA